MTHRVHQHGGRDAAEQQDGDARAHRLKRLHARLHVVAVARHAADKAGQAERVELRAGEVRRLCEQRPAHIVRHAVRVVDGDAVRAHVELARGHGREDHQRAPQRDERAAAQRHDLIDEVREDVGDGKLRHRAEELDEDREGDAPRIRPHVVRDEFQRLSPPLSGNPCLVSVYRNPARVSTGATCAQTQNPRQSRRMRFRRVCRKQRDAAMRDGGVPGYGSACGFVTARRPRGTGGGSRRA